jgi:hypothetical protein
VKDYVLARRQHQREVFVPLRHDAGHAQADFGEALAVIGGVERKIHFFDGNGNAVFSKEITFTDFPLPEIKLFFQNNTIFPILILPGRPRHGQRRSE